MTHTYVPTHAVTQTWASIFLHSIYHRGNASCDGVYHKFVPCSRFIRINTSWALKTLLLFILWLSFLPNWSQDSKVVQEATIKPVQSWLIHRGIASIINWGMLKKASRQRTSAVWSFLVSQYHYLQMGMVDYSQRCYGSHRGNSPTFSREWLCTEEPAGCFGPRGPQTRRKDSSLRPSPHSSDGLQWEREREGGTITNMLRWLWHPPANSKPRDSSFLCVCPSHLFPAFHPPTTPHLWRDTRPQTMISWRPRQSGTFESACVVDTVTSSEAMSRHPSVIRSSITASSFSQLYHSLF